MDSHSDNSSHLPTNQHWNLPNALVGPKQTLSCYICHSNSKAHHDHLLVCAGCRLLYHGFCVVPQVQASLIWQHNLTWYCPKCDQRRQQLGPRSAPAPPPVASNGNNSLQNPRKRVRSMNGPGGSSSDPLTQEQNRRDRVRRLEDTNLAFEGATRMLQDQVESLERGADNLNRETLQIRESLRQERQKLLHDHKLLEQGQAYLKRDRNQLRQEKEHLSQDERGIQQLKQQLGQDLSRLDQDQVQLGKDQDQLSRDRQELAQVDEASKDALHQAKNHEQRIVELERTADLRCKEIDDRNATIKDYDKAIIDREHELLEARKRNEHLEQVIAEMRDQVENNERDLVKTQAKLSDREIDLSGAEWQIWQRNEDVKALRKQIEDRDSHLVQTQAELRNRDVKAEKLREQLADLRQDLASAVEGNRDRNSKLERAHADLRDQANRLAVIMSIVSKSSPLPQDVAETLDEVEPGEIFESDSKG